MAATNRLSARLGRWALGLCLAGLATTASMDAQERALTTGKPADVGMSAGVLEGGVALYREAVARGDLVGAVVLVARKGTVVVHEAIGSRNVAANLPMERNTMFRMASNTKPVVATAIAMLAERKQVAYTDLVRTYLPTWDNYKAGFIQIHHLLSHTSGLRIPTLFLRPPDGADSTTPRTLQKEAARFGEVGAAVVPGTSYSYSNPGYNTLGALIEMRSGKPLERFLTEEIYRPLGMADSYHMETAGALDGKLSRMSVVYYQQKNGQWVPGWTPGDPPVMPFVRASGGMISTAWDYALFCQMFLNGGTYGGRRLLQPATIARMVRSHTPEEGDDAAGDGGYGYGWSISDDGVYSHGGSDGTFAWVDPSRQIIGLVFTQTPRGKNPVPRFQELVNLSLERTD